MDSTSLANGSLINSSLIKSPLISDPLQGQRSSPNPSKLSDTNSITSSSTDLGKTNLKPSVFVSISVNAQPSQVSATEAAPELYSRASIGASARAEQYTASNGQVTPQGLSDTEKASVEQVGDEPVGDTNKEATTANSNDKGEISGNKNSSELALDDQEQEQLQELKLRDREVRAHEQAHKSAGGQYAGAISLSYQSGPDGKRYAVGGEVSIDVSPVSGDPQATIAKMNVVRAAASAPANPSAQDRSVAAAASSAISKAQGDLVALAAESVPPADIEGEDKGEIKVRDQQQNNDPQNATAVNAYEAISTSKPTQQESIIDALV